MLVALIAALAIAGSSPAPTPAPSADPQVEAAIASIRAEYAKVEAYFAQQPPARDDSERLERLGPLDQAGRQAMRRIDFSSLPEAERSAAQAAAISEIVARDRANLAALKAMVPAQGWFTKDRYSPAAREAAFLIVQHATDDPAFMHDVLMRMEPLVATGDVAGTSFAMLYDRVALQEDRPQRYGTQMVCKDHRWVLGPLETPERVDERRRQVGFTDTAADYAALFADRPACG